MRIEVRGHGFEIERELSGYAERRLLFALTRFSRRIEVIRARLSDMNGPRGGVDKECRLAAVVAPVGEILVVERDADMRAAIDLGADRLARAVARKVGRRRSRPRVPARNAGS